MKVKFETFRSGTTKWRDLFAEAAEFASSIGEQRVLNITTSCDHSDSLVTVWYWGK